MIKEKKTFNYFNILLDAMVIMVSCMLTWFIVLKFNLFNLDTRISLVPFSFISVGLIPVYLMIYIIFHLYILKRTLSVWTELANICKSNFIGCLIFMSVAYFFQNSFYMFYFPRAFIILFSLLNMVLMIIVREGAGRIRYMMKRRLLN